MIVNDNSEEEIGVEELGEKKEKKGFLGIRSVPENIKTKLSADAKKNRMSMGEYLIHLMNSYETSIHNVSKEAKDSLIASAESLGILQSDYINMLLLTQNTTIRNVEPEAISAAMMIAGRLNIPLSQFISNAILKESHDIIQGKNNKPVALIPGEEVMTVDKVETLMREFKSEVIDIIKELKKEETFFDKLKGLIK